MPKPVPIERCRICGNAALTPVLSLGEQYLTGRFPRSREEKLLSMPLELVKCDRATNAEACGLLQLRYTAALNEMYGLDYGYRSGLNASMVAHLKGVVERVEDTVSLAPGDLIIDIGSNDSTTLRQYRTAGLHLVGIDPAGPAFQQYYPDHISLVPEYFSAEAVRAACAGKPARVVTSMAMFYDLPDPVRFVRDIHSILAPGGIWVFEQSYLPTMMAQNSYDTICHEHLEYYTLAQIRWITSRVGLHITRVELTEANGGSFLVFARKPADGESRAELPQAARELLAREEAAGMDTLKPYQDFAERASQHRLAIRRFFAETRAAKKVVAGYGASTKGNVLLQYCGITVDDIPFIADVNPKKFGAFTPGTGIPIISEEEARRRRPDYFLVLPWHFRQAILKREAAYQDGGWKFVFPLPRLEIV